MVKLLLISNDYSLQNFLEKNSKDSEFYFSPYSVSNDALDIMSHVCSNNPSLLIIDDDFVKPISERLLASIKKVNPKLPIIFITSNTSLELGRAINSIGVKYYLMKPLSDEDLREFITSITENLVNKYTI
jgi:DNA-binding response OmpR family regulator